MKLSTVIEQKHHVVTGHANNEGKFDDEVLEENALRALKKYIDDNAAGNYKVKIARLILIEQFGNQLKEAGFLTEEELKDQKDTTKTTLEECKKTAKSEAEVTAIATAMTRAQEIEQEQQASFTDVQTTQEEQNTTTDEDDDADLAAALAMSLSAESTNAGVNNNAIEQLAQQFASFFSTNEAVRAPIAPTTGTLCETDFDHDVNTDKNIQEAMLLSLGIRPKADTSRDAEIARKLYNAEASQLSELTVALNTARAQQEEEALVRKNARVVEVTSNIEELSSLLEYLVGLDLENTQRQIQELEVELAGLAQGE